MRGTAACVPCAARKWHDGLRVSRRHRIAAASVAPPPPPLLMFAESVAGAVTSRPVTGSAGALHTCGVDATSWHVAKMLPLMPLLLGGCFSYVALTGGTPAGGSEVVARLSVPLAIPLQDVTVRQVSMATGRVAYADADSIVLVAESFSSDAGSSYPGFGTNVTILRNHIGSLEERRVSKGRTLLVLGEGAGPSSPSFILSDRCWAARPARLRRHRHSPDGMR